MLPDMVESSVVPDPSSKDDEFVIKKIADFISLAEERQCDNFAVSIDVKLQYI